MPTVDIGSILIGDGQPVFTIAELGINHNGEWSNVQRMIAAAKAAGADAVKFQKRTPELCVPEEQRSKLRDTPWGSMTYMDYRHRIELGRIECALLKDFCEHIGIIWFASVFDIVSCEFMAAMDAPIIKIPSCCLTDRELLEAARFTDKPVMLSTGMSSMEEITAAVDVLDRSKLLLAHATSTYPCPKSELNLRAINELKHFGCPVGYSGHEVGLATTVASVALGATFIERHITLDRSMWGSDQAASVEPQGFKALVDDIRAVEESLGDGIKRVYPSEAEAAKRLRVKNTLLQGAV